jgi:hypothetical protein
MSREKIGDGRGRTLVEENAHLPGKRWLVQATGGKVEDRDDLVARQAVVELDQVVDRDTVFQVSNTTETGIRVPAEDPGAAHLSGNAFHGGALGPVERCHIRSLFQG